MGSRRRARSSPTRPREQAAVREVRRGDRPRGRDRGTTSGDDPLLLRVGGRPGPQAGALLPDAADGRRRRESRRRDGGRPLVPGCAGLSSAPRTAANARCIERAVERLRVTPCKSGSASLVGFGRRRPVRGRSGVGGGIVTTPAVNVLLGGTAIQAVATPLPVILPTSLVGAFTYARAGEVSFRAAAWAAVPGVGGAVGGAFLTELVNAHLLLVITAGLMAWTAVQVIRGAAPRTAVGAGSDARMEVRGDRRCRRVRLRVCSGSAAGSSWSRRSRSVIGMPLKRALGTSLARDRGPRVPGHDRALGARQHRLGHLPACSPSAWSPAPGSALASRSACANAPSASPSALPARRRDRLRRRRARLPGSGDGGRMAAPTMRRLRAHLPSRSPRRAPLALPVLRTASSDRAGDRPSSSHAPAQTPWNIAPSHPATNEREVALVRFRAENLGRRRSTTSRSGSRCTAGSSRERRTRSRSRRSAARARGRDPPERGRSRPARPGTSRSPFLARLARIDPDQSGRLPIEDRPAERLHLARGDPHAGRLPRPRNRRSP